MTQIKMSPRRTKLKKRIKLPMIKKLILSLSLLISTSLVFANTSFYIQAHQDDWQLFMGSSAMKDIKSGNKVVFIYTTAGNAAKPNPQDFWVARELAALESTKFATENDNVNCSISIVNGHNIKRCETGNAISYFMRIISGDISSLRVGESIGSTIDSSTSYASWNDFHSTLKQIILDEKTSGSVWINAPEFCTCLLSGSNPDHLDTARAVYFATTGEGWGRVWYLDYIIRTKDINTSQEDYMNKVSTFMIYDRTMQENYIVNGRGESTYCESDSSASLYSQWLLREYRRSDNGINAVGCSPCPSTN